MRRLKTKSERWCGEVNITDSKTALLHTSRWQSVLNNTSFPLMKWIIRGVPLFGPVRFQAIVNAGSYRHVCELFPITISSNLS